MNYEKITKIPNFANVLIMTQEQIFSISNQAAPGRHQLTHLPSDPSDEVFLRSLKPWRRRIMILEDSSKSQSRSLDLNALIFTYEPAIIFIHCYSP